MPVRALVMELGQGEAGAPPASPACQQASLAQAAAAWRGGGSLVWLDVTAPDPAQLTAIGQGLDLSFMAVETALHRNQRPGLDRFGDYIVLTLYLPADPAAGAAAVTLGQFCLIFGARFLVTTHAAPEPLLERIAARCGSEGSPLAGGAGGLRGLGGLVHHMVDAIVDAYFPLLDEMAERVETVQELAYFSHSGRGDGLDRQRRADIRALFPVRRDLLALRRVMGPTADTLRLLAREDLDFYSEPTAIFFQDVFDHSVRLLQTIQLQLDLLHSTRDAYQTHLSNELGLATRRLLVFTCLLSVPTWVATTYGMNFQVMAELGWPVGHGWALALIAILDIALLLLFRRHRLL